MIIGGLQKLTLIDYPGKLAATIFLAGCNFRCPWCYSSELVLPEKIVRQPKISEKELFNFLKERRGLLEGIVLCGGEPTINKGLLNFTKKIKKLGYAVKLDTNGSNPKMLKKLINNNLIDYVAMDVKLPKEKYPEIFKVKVHPVKSSKAGASKKQFNGIKIKDIEESIKILKNNKIDYEFRTTVIPTVLKKEDIIKIAKWIKGAPKYYLQNFRPEKTVDPKFEKVKPYSRKYLLEIQKAILPFFEICRLRE